MKTVLEEPSDNRCLLTIDIDLKPLRSYVKERILQVKKL